MKGCQKEEFPRDAVLSVWLTTFVLSVKQKARSLTFSGTFKDSWCNWSRNIKEGSEEMKQKKLGVGCRTGDSITEALERVGLNS